ncbi:hypothetical protein DLJ54_10095 [Corynebacterium heidelbergense]|uniref:Uncharacterized protein n=1 Tax=Corynebacterium heidelbergense TaxID=2055947 RepID=A0A364V3A2_9CORY|nr:hypothetical protein DLJ54_10095 [Corynebacterium heidelbergense]
MEMQIDPPGAMAAAARFRDAQQQWHEHLMAHQPDTPIAAFGTGLAAQAARLHAARQRVHRIREQHAQLLAAHGQHAHAEAAAVGQAEETNVGGLTGVQAGLPAVGVGGERR